MTKLYLFCKKIHRLLVLLIIVAGLIMAGTGVLMKFSEIAKRFTFIDMGLMRYLHNNLSTVFAVLLLLMALTGFIMYLFPFYQRRKARQSVMQHTDEQSPH